MRHYFFPLGLVFMLIGFSNCSVLVPSPERIADYQLRVQYHQDACFGRCPVYTLSLYDNGLLVYQGERFTEKPGLWYRLIGQRETQELIDSFQNLDFASYPSTFPSRVPDMAARSLRYIDESGRDHKTTFKEERPDQLLELAERMLAMAEAEGFKKYDGPNSGIFGETPDLAPQEIIVELQASVNAAAWIVNYSKQNVQLKERISPGSDYYLITADPNLMDADELLPILRQDPEVMSAQRNQQLSPR